MNILILGINYLPESTSIGPYTADLAQYLQAKGHQVQVITGFPSSPQWRIWDGYRGRLFMREKVNDVSILRTFLWMPSQPKNAPQRILFDMSFTLSSFLGGVSSGPADLILVISPPLQLGLTGWLLGILKNAPFLFHLQDLLPDAAIATGMMNGGSRAIKIARALERFIYKRARAIGVISEGFARNLSTKEIPAGKIVPLPNYIDLHFMRTFPRENDFRKRHNIASNDFLVMYSGSVALKQGLQTFVEAACLCMQEEIQFYLVGEGPFLSDLKALVEEKKAPRMHFLNLQPRETLPEQLGAADVLVITQQKTVTDIVFPGKLLYYMAAGRPVLAAVNPASETGRFITRHQVGLVIPPEDPSSLAGAVIFLRNNPTLAEGMGENGRKVVEELFDKEIVLEKFATCLENLGNAASQG